MLTYRRFIETKAWRFQYEEKWFLKNLKKGFPRVYQRLLPFLTLDV